LLQQENAPLSFLSAFRMFVLSLSWQNDHFQHQMAAKDMRFLTGLREDVLQQDEARAVLI
jgi:hypothetical protein